MSREIKGNDYVVMKRLPLRQYLTAEVPENERYLKFSSDRFIASRKDLPKDYLIKKQYPNYDILNDRNDRELMQKNHFAHMVRGLIDFDYMNMKVDKPKPKLTTMLREDWKCYIQERKRFLPDFETLEKRSVGVVKEYLWSSHSIIGACSIHNICLYNPFKGYTRVLDFSSHFIQAIAFSNNGNIFVVATAKETRCLGKDIYIYIMPKEFQKGDVASTSMRTREKYCITSLMFTLSDKFIMMGMKCGSILIYSVTKKNEFIFFRSLEKHHDHAIGIMQYSAQEIYFASLDRSGMVIIWNGGSLTKICSIFVDKAIKYLEWHPFVAGDLIIGTKCPAKLYLVSVTRKEIVSSYKKDNLDVELTSFIFNKFTGELICNFFLKPEHLNRMVVLGSFDQVIASYEYEDYRAIKLFWNSDRNMLAAGFTYFKFCFWNYPVENKRVPAKKNQMQSTNKGQEPIQTIFKLLSQMR